MGPKKPKTRQASLVSPGELPVADLPTLADVLGLYTAEADKRGKNFNVLPFVIKSVKDLYRKVNSNLILVSDNVIKTRINRKYDMLKQVNRSKTSVLNKSKFEKALGELFDIIVCTCDIVPCSETDCTGCEHGAHSSCLCPNEVQIPQLELRYVMDQRSRSGGSKGSFQIVGADTKEMLEMEKEVAAKEKTDKRKEDDQAALEKNKKKEDEWAEKVKPVFETVDSADVDNNNFEDNFSDPKIQESAKFLLRNLAKECDRWGVSNRAGAAIANAALIDAGIITPEDQKHVIDKNKLRRALESYRNERKVEDDKALVEKQGQAYYLDGKKTMSLCVEEDGQGKKYNVFRELELVSVSSEPGGKYVTHLEPEGGKGEQVATSLFDYLSEHRAETSWQIVGGDSTAANTGKWSGAFACLEDKLGRRLVIIVCWLHLNELPLRHIFVFVDGPTSSKKTFKGVIVKIIPAD